MEARHRVQPEPPRHPQQQRHPAGRAVRHHQAVGPGRRRGRRQASLRAVAAAARPRLPRPVPDPPALRRLLQLLARDAGPVPAGRDQGDRGLQLLPRPAGRPHRPQRGHPRGQPDRDPPVLPARATTSSSCASAASSSSPGARSPRAATTCSPTRPSARSAPRTASRWRRSCCAGSSSASVVAIPKSVRRRADGGELRRLRLRAHRRADGPHRRAWTPAPRCSSTTATPRS